MLLPTKPSSFMGWSMAGSALLTERERPGLAGERALILIATDHVPAELYESTLWRSEQELIVWRPRHYCLKNGTTHETAF